jgi:DNA-directed RNA polymerase subunit K/omega
MSDIKSKAQGIDPNVSPRDINQLISQTGNVYEALCVISRRSRQISFDLKHEIQRKLDEFSVQTETIEEVHENKEQIEISKFYEKLPNTSILATQEFLAGELQWSFRDETEE